MSAYMSVELTVRDVEAKDRYSAGVGPILKSFGAEFIVSGPITSLFGEQPFANGSIIRFPDHEAAISFFNSPEYQSLIEDRTLGIDCRFGLLG